MISKKTIDRALDTGRVFVKIGSTFWRASRCSTTRTTGNDWFIVVHAGKSNHIISNGNDNVVFQIKEQA